MIRIRIWFFCWPRWFIFFQWGSWEETPLQSCPLMTSTLFSWELDRQHIKSPPSTCSSPPSVCITAFDFGHGKGPDSDKEIHFESWQRLLHCSWCVKKKKGFLVTNSRLLFAPCSNVPLCLNDCIFITLQQRWREGVPSLSDWNAVD